MTTRNIFSAILGAIAAVIAPLDGATIVQTNRDPGNTAPWNSPAVWGGDPVAFGNEYVTVPGGFDARTDTFSTATHDVWSYTSALRDTNGDNAQSTTFGDGALLRLASDTRLLMKGYAGTVSTANILLENNSLIVLAPNGGSGRGGAAILAGTLDIAAGATAGIGLIPGNPNPDSNTLDINSTITGFGTIELVTAGGANKLAHLTLSGDISAFEGTFYFSTNTGTQQGGAPATNSTFSISNSAPLATLNLATASPRFLFDLGADLTFGSVIVNSITLDPGIYSYSDLNAFAPGRFLDNGGSITVVPEPSTVLLCALGLVALMLRLRRSREALAARV